MAQSESVRLGHFVDVIGPDAVAGASHVFDQDVRITGNMLAQMTRNRTRVSIVATASRGGHDNAQSLSFVKRLLGWSSDERNHNKQDGGDRHRQYYFPHKVLLIG